MAQAPAGDMLGFLLGLQPMSGVEAPAPAAPSQGQGFLDDSAKTAAFVRGGVPAAHAWLPEEYEWDPVTFVRAPRALCVASEALGLVTHPAPRARCIRASVPPRRPCGARRGCGPGAAGGPS